MFGIHGMTICGCEQIRPSAGRKCIRCGLPYSALDLKYRGANMLNEFYVVFYEQYGTQYCTNGFEREARMRSHISMHLDRKDKDYIKNITPCRIKQENGKIVGMDVLTFVSDPQ